MHEILGKTGIFLQNEISAEMAHIQVLRNAPMDSRRDFLWLCWDSSGRIRSCPTIREYERKLGSGLDSREGHELRDGSERVNLGIRDGLERERDSTVNFGRNHIEEVYLNK